MPVLPLLCYNPSNEARVNRNWPYLHTAGICSELSRSRTVCHTNSVHIVCAAPREHTAHSVFQDRKPPLSIAIAPHLPSRGGTVFWLERSFFLLFAASLRGTLHLRCEWICYSAMSSTPARPRTHSKHGPKPQHRTRSVIPVAVRFARFDRLYLEYWWHSGCRSAPIRIFVLQCGFRQRIKPKCRDKKAQPTFPERDACQKSLPGIQAHEPC